MFLWFRYGELPKVPQPDSTMALLIFLPLVIPLMTLTLN